MSTPDDEPPVLVSTAVAAVAAGVEPVTMRQWKRRRKLTPVACDIATRSDLYDLADVMRAEAATRGNRGPRDNTTASV